MTDHDARIASEAAKAERERIIESLNLHQQIPEAWSERFERIWSELGIDLCANDDCLWWQMTYALQDHLRAEREGAGDEYKITLRPDGRPILHHALEESGGFACGQPRWEGPEYDAPESSPACRDCLEAVLARTQEMYEKVQEWENWHELVHGSETSKERQ